MDYNGFRKYFTPQNIIPQIIGTVLVAVGAVLLFIGRFFLYMGVVVAAIGLCIIVCARESRPSDSDLDEAVAKKIKDLDDTAKHQIDIREHLVKAFPPVAFSDFDFSGVDDGSGEFLIHKGRDGKYRTNRYSAAEIMFAQDKLHIYMIKFYVTEAKEEETTLSENYVNLKCARFENRKHTFEVNVNSGKKTKTVELEFKFIVIENNDGKTVFEMPVHEGADVDKTIEDINRLIETKKEGRDTVN